MRIALIATLAVALAATAVPSSGAAGDGDAEAGKGVFNANCTACHSATTTQTNVGPGLKGLFAGKKMPATGRPVSEKVVRDQILNGGGGMPGFTDSLKPADVDNLVAYLKTL
jgi:mono/diheme cytochrome c family protein